MKNKIVFLLIAVLGLATVAAAAPVAFSTTSATISGQCDSGEYQHQESMLDSNNVISSVWIICPVLGVINAIHSSDGVTIDEQHTATAVENQIYIRALAANEFDLSHARLANEVEDGKKWAQWLRGKADDARNVQANWAGWSPATRDVAMVEFWGTFAKELDGLADLLIVLDKGR